MQRERNNYNRDKTLINKALRGYLRRLKGPAALLKAMRYTLFTGGKRLRPVLTVESAKALGGTAARALPFACAIELIHNFSLVHDDLPSMDNDDTRRGKPACHKAFGEGLAILAGDALLNLAFGILAESRRRKTLEAVSLEAISLVADAVGSNNMIGGQVLDLARTKSRRINSMKTASLMAVSCRVGALAAEAKRRDTKRIYEFGRALGLAFQIADDIEDSTSGRTRFRRMRKKAASFISQAKNYIAPFGRRADTLNYIADKVLEKAYGKSY